MPKLVHKFHYKKFVEFDRSLRLALEGLEPELGLFLSEFEKMLDKSELDGLLLLDGEVLVLELL